MKQRVYEFEQGDLDSKIPITGRDELASLAKSVNKMTENIRILLNQKQMLLLDVSHELRTPLARMQLLVEMIPNHKNIVKLKEEILLGMKVQTQLISQLWIKKGTQFQIHIH